MSGGQGWWCWGRGAEVANIGARHTPLTRGAWRLRSSWLEWGLRPSRQHYASLHRTLLGSASVSQATSVRNILRPPATLGVASSGSADVRPGAGSSANFATILTVARCSCRSWPPLLQRQGGRGPTIHLRPELRSRLHLSTSTAQSPPRLHPSTVPPPRLHLSMPRPLGSGQPACAHRLQPSPPVCVVRA